MKSITMQQLAPYSAPGIRILGIDPGLNKTGYAVLERGTKGPILLECGLIRTERNGSVAERVHEVGKNVHEIIADLNPQILIIEQSFSLPKNPKSALLMSHVRGAVLYVAVEHQLKIFHYAATRIKKTLTGGGHASKEDIQEAVRRELKIDLANVPHDVADAVAIALCHYYAPIVEEQPAA